MKVVLVGGGDRLKKEYFKDLKYDKLIAIDGGLSYLRVLNIEPDLVIGDLDSVSEEDKKFIKDRNLTLSLFPVDKDYTDMELGINYCYENGINNIIICGATGSRLDHSLANIFLLKSYYKKGVKITLLNNNNKVFYQDGAIEVIKDRFKYLSLINLGDKSINIDLKGFKYPYKGIIRNDSTRTISNEIIGETGYIKAEEAILVIQSVD